jgi:MFS superfamily sulfate permease-like transporter
VFVIGVELIDIAGMRRILAVRLNEFVVAAITAVTVVAVGVEQAVILAIVVSLVNHLRRGYAPKDSVLVVGPDEHLRLVPPTPDARTLDGLVVYHFAASLYFANANHFANEILDLTAVPVPANDAAAPVPANDATRVRWLCIDASAIADVDYSGAQTINELIQELHSRGVRLVLAEVEQDVRDELDRYGLTTLIGTEAYFDTVVEVIEAYRHSG